MKQSEKHVESLMAVCAQPVFCSTKFKMDTLPMVAEAFASLPMFVNSPGQKQPFAAEVPTNVLNPERLAAGLLASLRTSD
jgi:hypothetical protein